MFALIINNFNFLVMENENKNDVEKLKKEAIENVKKTAQEEAKRIVEETVKMTVAESQKTIESRIEEIVKKSEGYVSAEDMKKEIATLQARLKKVEQTSDKDEDPKNIRKAIYDAIPDLIEKFGKGGGKVNVALKAVTDASFAGDALANQTTNVRRDLYMNPYSPRYLKNIFPNVTTDQASVVIPQMGVITGAAAVWDRVGDLPKPDVSPAYKDVTVLMQWLAGITTVNRELLLNVRYLQGSITNTLLYSAHGLFAAENKLITDYIAANAIAYAGDKTVALEKVIDAAFNQLLGNYMNPTHVLMNQADYLTYIKLNKAAGSGEYDLPNNALSGFTGTGLETNVEVVPVPSLVAGTAYVISAPEFEFITRMSPELRMDESGDNFTYNKVSFRIEEMVGFIAKDLNAAVKVPLVIAAP